jgi:hypothetical protein
VIPAFPIRRSFLQVRGALARRGTRERGARRDAGSAVETGVSKSWLGLVALLCLLASPALAEMRPDYVTVESRSKIFVVVGPQKGASWRMVQGKNQIRLEPAVLAVSCERIREALFSELGLPANWTTASQANRAGRIYLWIHPNSERVIKFIPVPSPSGFNYRIELPNSATSDDLIETVVYGLLLSLAGEKSPSKFVEIPLWLKEGFVEHLRATATEALTLQPNQMVQAQLRIDSLAPVRQALREKGTFSFEELSWPEKLKPEQAPEYKASAQLFVHQLLEFPRGRESLRHFITDIGLRENWQFAFLDAFKDRFARLLDVEKWWALTLVSFTGRDPEMLWAARESLQRLDAVLRVPVNVHATANRLPERSVISLQEGVRNIDRTRESLLLQNTIRELAQLRVRVSPELLPLLDAYQKSLSEYLEIRDPGERRDRSKNRAPVNLGVARSQFSKRLDQLDQDRARLRQKIFEGEQAALR